LSPFFDIYTFIKNSANINIFFFSKTVWAFQRFFSTILAPYGIVNISAVPKYGPFSSVKALMEDLNAED
jgi:hypothetical protein